MTMINIEGHEHDTVIITDYRGRRPYGTEPELPVINRYTCGMALSALAIWGAVICSAFALGVAAGVVRW